MVGMIFKNFPNLEKLSFDYYYCDPNSQYSEYILTKLKTLYYVYKDKYDTIKNDLYPNLEHLNIGDENIKKNNIILSIFIGV